MVVSSLAQIRKCGRRDFGGMLATMRSETDARRDLECPRSARTKHLCHAAGWLPKPGIEQVADDEDIDGSELLFDPPPHLAELRDISKHVDCRAAARSMSALTASKAGVSLPCTATFAPCCAH